MKYCKQEFSSEGKLQNHRITVHEGENEISCKIYNKKFIDIRHLNSHVKRIHQENGDPKNHKCNFCEGTFIAPFHLNIHVARLSKFWNSVHAHCLLKILCALHCSTAVE